MSAHTTLVGAVILAAGRSQRFGQDKRQALMPATGVSLLETVVRTHRAVLDTVWVITRDNDHFAEAICDACGARQLICMEADQGMGRSLATGVEAAMLDESGIQGLMVSLADMPGVQASTLRALVERFRATGQAVLPRYAAPFSEASADEPPAFTLGHPRIVPKPCWPALLALKGDQGARHVLDWSQAQAVDVNDEGVLLDVDRPEDLARLSS